MLNDLEKEKIKAEEIYRLEVRSKIPNQKASIWKFINSPFGLWFLSTIAVGFITWGYSILQSKYEQNRIINERVRRLDIEIFERVYAYDVALRSIVDDKGKNTGVWLKALEARADLLKLYSSLFTEPEPIELSSGVIIPVSNVFEEFSGRSAKGLMVELAQYLPSAEQEQIGRRIDWMEYNYIVFARRGMSVEEFYENTSNLLIERWKRYKRPPR